MVNYKVPKILIYTVYSFRYMRGDFLDPQGCKIEWGWKEPMEVGHAVSFKVKVSYHCLFILPHHACSIHCKCLLFILIRYSGLICNQSRLGFVASFLYVIILAIIMLTFLQYRFYHKSK